MECSIKMCFWINCSLWCLVGRTINYKRSAGKGSTREEHERKRCTKHSKEVLILKETATMQELIDGDFEICSSSSGHQIDTLSKIHQSALLLLGWWRHDIGSGSNDAQVMVRSVGPLLSKNSLGCLGLSSLCMRVVAAVSRWFVNWLHISISTT